MRIKKISSILLALTLLFIQCFNGITVEAAGDTLTTEFLEISKSVSDGDEVTVTLVMTNHTESDINGVTIEYHNNDSFSVKGNTSKALDIKANSSVPVNFTLECSNTDNNLIMFNISYATGSDVCQGYVTFKTDSGSPSSPVDTSKYTPSFEVRTEKVITADAGEEITLPLIIENVSSYSAKNLTITPVFDSVFYQADYGKSKVIIDSLSGKKIGKVELKVKVNEDVQKKTYPLKIKITGLNPYSKPFEVEETIYIKIENIHYDAKLIVQKVDFDTVGNQTSVNINFANQGTLPASDVVITMAENENFAVSDNITEKFFVSVPAIGDKKVQFNIMPKTNLKPGTYPIKVNTTFKNIKGEKVSKDHTIYVPYKVSDSVGSDANIIVKNIKIPDSVNASEKFELNFAVENNGESVAKNVVVSLVVDEKIVPYSLSKLSLGDIEGNGITEAKFVLMATDEIESKNYPIKILIEYDKYNERESIEQYVGVYANGKTNNKYTLVPKVIISGWNPEPEMVKAGEKFTLNIEVKNTSKDKAVENMEVTLIVAEGTENAKTVFTPVKSSTYYIDKLGQGQVYSKSLEMSTIPDAQPINYSIKVLCEYEYLTDEGYVSGTSEDVKGINVIQPTRLEVVDVMVDMEAEVNRPTSINVDFFNRGQVKIQNLMITTEGDFTVEGGNYYVGNFESGNSDYYEATVIPEKEGESKGKVIFSYEDAAGKEHILKKEFTINAMPAMEMDKFPGNGMDNPGINIGEENLPEEKSNKWIFIIIGVVAVVGVTGVIVIRKKIKKKKGLTYNEDI